jgi:spore coat protein U-like protein
MRLESTLLRPFIVVLLALVTFPATPAQTQRLPGQRVPTPGVTDHAILPVTIEIVQACRVSASDLHFGVYASNSPTPVLGQTTIQLTCGAGVTAELSLDAGTGVGASTSNRRMEAEGGRGRISYGLFQDPGRTIHWGDRSGRDTLEVLSTGALQTVPIYGQIPAGQREQEGTYSDMITVTVHY